MALKGANHNTARRVLNNHVLVQCTKSAIKVFLYYHYIWFQKPEASITQHRRDPDYESTINPEFI